MERAVAPDRHLTVELARRSAAAVSPPHVCDNKRASRRESLVRAWGKCMWGKTRVSCPIVEILIGVLSVTDDDDDDERPSSVERKRVKAYIIS